MDIDIYNILQNNSKQVSNEIRLKTILRGRLAILKYLKVVDTTKEKTDKIKAFKCDLENIAFMLNEWSLLDNEVLRLKNENTNLKAMLKISDYSTIQSNLFKENQELHKENDCLKKYIEENLKD